VQALGRKKAQQPQAQQLAAAQASAAIAFSSDKPRSPIKQCTESQVGPPALASRAAAALRAWSKVAAPTGACWNTATAASVSKIQKETNQTQVKVRPIPAVSRPKHPRTASEISRQKIASEVEQENDQDTVHVGCEDKYLPSGKSSRWQ